MKRITLLLLGTIGVGLLGVSTSSAAPVNGAAIAQSASAEQLTQNVWYRWGPGWGWRAGWGYRPWGYRPWGWGPGWAPGWGARWCYFHPYRCGRW
jgi:hypothetical protein